MSRDDDMSIQRPLRRVPSSGHEYFEHRLCQESSCDVGGGVPEEGIADDLTGSIMLVLKSRTSRIGCFRRDGIGLVREMFLAVF